MRKKIQPSINVLSFITKDYLLVFPAASNPSINILISLLPKIFDNSLPILSRSLGSDCYPWGWGIAVNINIIKILLHQPQNQK